MEIIPVPELEAKDLMVSRKKNKWFVRQGPVTAAWGIYGVEYADKGRGEPVKFGASGELCFSAFDLEHFLLSVDSLIVRNQLGANDIKRHLVTQSKEARQKIREILAAYAVFSNAHHQIDKKACQEAIKECLTQSFTGYFLDLDHVTLTDIIDN